MRFIGAGLFPVLNFAVIEGDEKTDYQARFSGIARLYGQAGLERLRRAHVCVVGVGGVGSWAVEALARSGIGALTLIDLDEVCLSNTNRQLPALTQEVGKPKVEVLAARVHGINPDCRVNAVVEFFTASNADTLLEPRYDCLLDAIDNVRNKCLLIARARSAGIPVFTTGGAGGRRDPAAIKTADLAFSTHDPLLQQVRRKLRLEHGFPLDPKLPFLVESVFSTEPPIFPRPDGTVCATRDPNADVRLNCESGYGTATFVTGAFGFSAAGRIIQRLVEQAPE